MPEWTEPRTWTVGEKLRAADLNAQVRDNMLVLATLGAVKDEITSVGFRSADTYGPLDDMAGPSVAFRTGPSGQALVVMYGQGRVTETGASERGYASYRIVRNSDSEEVVPPSDWRTLLFRDQLGVSASFVWLEDDQSVGIGLAPDTEYTAEMVYRFVAEESGGSLDMSHRRIMAFGVRPIVEEA